MSTVDENLRGEVCGGACRGSVPIDEWAPHFSATCARESVERRRGVSVEDFLDAVMSSVYTLEPPTEGKVVVYTTLGELEIELFSREAPLACRNFVQLCLEGCVLTDEDATCALTLTDRVVVAGISMRMSLRGA